jgi:L-galactose dehydrogenase
MMQYRELGKTGLRVSAISLGGVALGDMYGKLGPGEAEKCVHHAIDAGINLIDTSPYYGLTRSERVLGEVLAGGWRERVYLCTKAGRNGLADFDFSPAAIQRSVDGSLQRLGTDYVDILIAHDIEFADDFEKVFSETAAVLHRLKAAGKCRFVGMSAYPLRILTQAIERANLDVVISYCHYTLQNQRLVSELLPVAESHGVGVLNASPLCMGLLTSAGPQDWHPAPAALKEAARAAADLCQQRGTDIASLGMQFCCGEPRIASTISGAARAAEVDANLHALKTAADQSLVKEVQAIFGPLINHSWPSGNWKRP